MEVLLPNACDVQKFVMAWVAAAGDAAGQATKIGIELEALESQGELCRLIQQSMTGIAQARKSLAALGPNPAADNVESILRTAPCMNIVMSPSSID